MSNPSKQKGSSWESEVVRTLHLGVPGPGTTDRAFGPAHVDWQHVHRNPPQGAVDKGDVGGIRELVIECKSCRTFDLAGWIAEAEVERKNAGAEFGVVWAKRPRKTQGRDGYVIMDGWTFMRLLAKAKVG